jgi:hypothetical protein
MVSSNNKTDDCHNITEILLKVALHTINLNLLQGRHGLACMVFDLGQTNPTCKKLKYFVHVDFSFQILLLT